MARIHIALWFLLLFATVACGADKPRTRAMAETRNENLLRYKLGGSGANANETLGVDVKYTDGQQGASVIDFEVDSTAKKAGLDQYDVILEVDGSPIGLLRDRYYELWPQYGRSGSQLGKYLSEVLVSYVASDGDRRYYYPVVPTQKVTGNAAAAPLPPDFFTSKKPVSRTDPELRDKNIARYVVGYGNFAMYGKYELGVTVAYSYGYGGTIQTIKAGSPAEKAGLKVGDNILEVAGAPVGVFGDRVYEVWRQYVYSTDGMVEFLVNYNDDTTGASRYYYPQIQLDKSTVGN